MAHWNNPQILAGSGSVEAACGISELMGLDTIYVTADALNGYFKNVIPGCVGNPQIVPDGRVLVHGFFVSVVDPKDNARECGRRAGDALPGAGTGA